MDAIFEREFSIFLEKQKQSASGLRLEQLQKDLVGEKKMLAVLIWPVFQSFEDFVLEYEVITPSGVRIFIDVFYEPLRLAFESEGFAVHAELITRDRFSFERMRVRTMAAYGYKYIPFTWDELDKKPEACRRFLYELLGRYSGVTRAGVEAQSIQENEVIRQAVCLNRTFRRADVMKWLKVEKEGGLKVIRSLLEKGMIQAVGRGTIRHHEYSLTEQARSYWLDR